MKLLLGIALLVYLLVGLLYLLSHVDSDSHDYACAWLFFEGGLLIIFLGFLAFEVLVWNL